jgi:hypothetical protein
MGATIDNTITQAKRESGPWLSSGFQDRSGNRGGGEGSPGKYLSSSNEISFAPRSVTILFA